MMSYISRWLLLVSVVLQISNLKAILYSGHFFLRHPVEPAKAISNWGAEIVRLLKALAN